MISELIQTSAPTKAQILAVLPVSAAKAALRVFSSIEDTSFEDWIVAAYHYLFGESGRLNRYVALQEEFDWFTDSVSSGMELPMRPLRTVSVTPTFSVIQADGSYAAVSSTLWTTIYSRIDFPKLMRVPSASAWPTPGIVGHPKAYKFHFAAGATAVDAPTGVPPSLVQAMKFLVGHLYQNREATYEDFRITAVSRKIEYGVDQFAGAFRLAMDHS